MSTPPRLTARRARRSLATVLAAPLLTAVHSARAAELPSPAPPSPAPTETPAPLAVEPPLDTSSAGAGSVPARAAEAWPGVSLGWDLRAEGISMFKRYTLGARDAWFSGEGVGAGASVSLHFRPAAALTRAGVLRWIELEVGASNSTHWVSWKEGEGGASDRFVETAASGVIGVHFGSGRWARANEGRPWSGVVAGIAWLPTYVYFFGDGDFGSSGKFNPAGLRWTLDWGRVAPDSPGVVPGLRGSITWLPYVGNLPTMFSLALGCVFY